MTFTKKDFKIDWFSGKGAGGQHRNKHQNCVRITHIESGITVVGQEFRERKRNFESAFRRMAELLVMHYEPPTQAPRAPVTETIRSYNIPDDRVTDKASGMKYAWDGFDIGDAILDRKLAENRG